MGQSGAAGWRPVHLRAEPSRPGLPAVLSDREGEFAAIIDDLSVETPSDLYRSMCSTESGHCSVPVNPLRVADRAAAVRPLSGPTRMASPTRRSAPILPAIISCSAATKPSSTSWDIRATISRSPAAFWRDLNALTAELDEPGRFVCIPGYEWSANTAVGGDRNVDFRHEGETLHRSSHAQITEPRDMADEAAMRTTAQDLFERLHGRDCVVMAHVGGRYADIVQAHDGAARDRGRGAFRLGHLRVDPLGRVRAGLSRRHRRQFGRAQGSAGRLLSRRVVLRQLRRADLLPRAQARSRRHLRSMRRRHHYATTGNRMHLDVEVCTASDARLFLRDPAAEPDAPSYFGAPQ